MKIIEIKDKKNEKENYEISVLPDSMLFRNNESFFIPDFNSTFCAEIGIIIKIDKLGKNISEKFAHRYFSQFTTCINFLASDLYTLLLEKKQSPDIAVAFDKSMSISNLKEKSVIYKQSPILNILINNEQKEINIQQQVNSIEKYITIISDHITLKIGDLIFIPATKITQINTNDSISIEIYDNIHKCLIK